MKIKYDLVAVVDRAGGGFPGAQLFRQAVVVETSRCLRSIRAAPTIHLTSPAFPEGGTIPREFTCDGANKSPPLEWSGVPQTARSLVLICDDPDAPMGTWSHWVAYDLSPQHHISGRGSRGGCCGGARAEDRRQAAKARRHQGYNDFGKIGYGGPCPPSGVHHYVFRLYALDERTGLPPGATRATVFKAIEGHILAEGHLTGKYAR